jgi:hypothetical protein
MEPHDPNHVIGMTEQEARAWCKKYFYRCRLLMLDGQEVWTDRRKFDGSNIDYRVNLCIQNNKVVYYYLF